MKKHLKFVAMILCICMTVTALPNGVFAAEGAVKEVKLLLILPRVSTNQSQSVVGMFQLKV
jgi:hypothetical protein